MKKGLILEGGAMRGMFTAGVLDVMMENGIEFDGAIGVSAGAAFGCNYKSKQIGRTLRYNVRFCKDPRYCGIRSLIKTGNLYNRDFCYKEVPLKYDIFDFETYKNNPMEFYVVCTDINTGKPVYKKCDDFDNENFEWIRASASMPIVSTVVEIDGYSLLDGGISDSIPIRYFESIGYDRNIVILTQPRGYRKNKIRLLPAIKAVTRKYPMVSKALENRHNDYNNSVDYIYQKEKEGKLLVIAPYEKLQAGKIEHNPTKLERAYEIGRETALKRIDEIKEYLSLSNQY